MTDVTCPRCEGAMRVADYEYGDLYAEDGMMPCPECEGNGTVDEDTATDYNAWAAAFATVA